MQTNVPNQKKNNVADTPASSIPDDYKQIIEARHYNPFNVLGRHPTKSGTVIRAFVPNAKQVWIISPQEPMQRMYNSDLFEWHTEDTSLADHYQIHWLDANDNQHEFIDPYTFAPQIPDFDLHLFQQGKHWHLYRILGAHTQSIDGIEGVLFAVWAPNAQRVSVVGDFNYWDGRQHSMRNRGDAGVWEIFIPGLNQGCTYKFEIRNNVGDPQLKADPYAQAYELRPKTASIVLHDSDYAWQDQDWMAKRIDGAWLHQPLSIYEVHLGSWRRDANGDFLNYRVLAEQLVDYVKTQGYTHIQLLPITEHPLDASWGYQTTGYFAPTRRFGDPDDFRYFVDTCHRNNIGVLLDWVPAHFPKDAHALAKFDGTSLYEHEDPRRGEHRDWGTLIYNYGRNEVRNFLLCSAICWLEEFHLDGLRVDAVASMLYLDYSREEGDWLANKYGGNENLEAIDFFRELNGVVHGQFPGAMMIAEESTAWPQVTRPTWLGGLGFSMKWNMGWMHDTLEYMNKETIHRHYHHNQLTFGLLYAFTENFVLPLSHDEVVHGKGSMLNRMPGDEWQKFANLRLLYTYMYTYPGKKISFMGNEFGQGTEWNFDKALDWYVLEYPFHQGILKLTADLNHLYRSNSELHYYDFDECGFDWIDCHDASQSIISYIRQHKDKFVITILNFTPVPRLNYTIGVPKPGTYHEVFNSDSSYYHGGNTGNQGEIQSQNKPWMGREHSIELTIPPLAGIVIQLKTS